MTTPVQASEQTYVVTPDDSGLMVISLRLFGTTKFWKKIANWNRLSPPYRLEPNQTLLIMAPPKIQPPQGNKLVFEMWKGILDKRQDERKVELQPKKAENTGKNAILKKKFTARLQEIKQQELREDPESAELNSEQSFERAKQLLEENKFPEALSLFNKSRTTNPDYLPAWLFEIRTLKQLKKDQEANTLTIQMLDKYPDMNQLPAFQEIKNP